MNLPKKPLSAEAQVTLDNCAREPIHIPGSIQPHGALLAFDRLGRLVCMSANAPEMLGVPLTIGRAQRSDEISRDPEARRLIDQAVASLGTGESAPEACELSLNGQRFDLVVHASGGLCLCEFEQRGSEADQLSSFALLAYRSMDKLKRQTSIERLLEVAVAEVRAMTGFDRVMAYRFRHDDSGDVVAESVREDMDPYLGRRYPASDIPAQARRLYVLNTLRLIANVAYRPVPLIADVGHTEPVDLSHSVLRSVSPIHIEYLSNMGVGASMSVSIVVGGRLWGMLACHHMQPLRVPYSIRMATDVMAQLIAASVQSITARDREAAMGRAALLRTDIAAQIAQGHEAADVLTREAASLCASLEADALLVGIDGRQRCYGPVDDAWATALVAQLQAGEAPLVHLSSETELPADGNGEKFCGALGLRFDGPRAGWLVFLRCEQVETIRWGGRPEKEVTHGPLGPRLTPRGSFDEWRETVRGTAIPWAAHQLESASLLLDAVSRAHASRVLEVDRLRSQLWAVLGHDLRDPLNTLSVASHALERQPSTSSTRLNTVIRNSTNRMERLLRDLQDITRIQNGLGLALAPEETDLAALLTQLLDDQRLTYPGMKLEAEIPAALPAHLDPMRFLQMATNLLSNARHHGKGSISVALALQDGHARLRVGNPAEPIPEELVSGLFDPFKRSSMDNARNPGSMGLGLYIVAQIASAHGGSIGYQAGDGLVFFELKLPVVSS